jgi:hypothetical protein
VTSDPDAMWRRPAASDPDDQPATEPRPDAAKPTYTGPPPTRRPPQVVPAPLIQPLPPPRELPPQDHDAIDAEEQQARMVTYGVSIVAGVLTLLLFLFVILKALSG